MIVDLLITAQSGNFLHLDGFLYITFNVEAKGEQIGNVNVLHELQTEQADMESVLQQLESKNK